MGYEADQYDDQSFYEMFSLAGDGGNGGGAEVVAQVEFHHKQQALASYIHPAVLAPITEGEIHIHTSDRIAFRRCRRKWAWLSPLRHNLTSKDVPSYFWLGSGVHFALEDYHGYNLFGSPEVGLRVYSDACIRSAEKGGRNLPEDHYDQLEMGLAMMKYYKDSWLKTREPMKTFWHNNKPQCEVRFKIKLPILGPLGQEVFYQGTLDRVIIDEFGRLWICVAKDTWTQKRDGIFCRIQDHPDAKFNGVRKIVEVRTNRGYSVKCTPDHEIMTTKGWVEAQDLKYGDLLPYTHSQHPQQPISDFWWMIGYWLGDGSLRNHGRGSIDFAVGNDKEELEKRLNRVFSEEVKFAANKQTTGYCYVTNQAEVADFIRDLFGIEWGTKDNEYIKYQKSLFLPLDEIENLRSFLQGLFDADGCVSTTSRDQVHISLSSKSHQLITDTQIALTSFGCACTIHEDENKWGKWYRLTLSDTQSVRNFADRIGFGLSRKQQVLDEYKRQSSGITLPYVTEVVEAGESEVYDLLDQPDQMFGANGLIVHNCEYKTAKMFLFEHLDVDDQISSYAWAASVLYPSLPIEGVIYMQFRKAIPEGPMILRNGGVSINKNQSTTATLYKKALWEIYKDPKRVPAANINFYNTLLMQENEDGDRFVRRDRIRRNERQLQSQGVKIMLEVEEMLNPDLPLYPNPTRDCTWQCPLMQVCIALDDGSDWEAMLEDTMMPRLDSERDEWRTFIEHPQSTIDVMNERNVERLVTAGDDTLSRAILGPSSVGG
jgi:DNA-binding transcriptional regulator WhiA